MLAVRRECREVGALPSRAVSIPPSTYLPEGDVVTTTETRDPSETFANPFIACTTCGVRVYWWSVKSGNDPCGHRGSNREVSAVSIGKRVAWNEHTDAWKSLCPSWGPVDGCRCSPPCVPPSDADGAS